MKRRPMWHTHVFGVMTIAAAGLAYHAVSIDNIWMAVLYSWWCGAAGAHVNRDMVDRREQQKELLVPHGSCERCGQPVCYEGARFCGALCTARWEADPRRLITVTDTTDLVDSGGGDDTLVEYEYMCPNCCTPWKCNGPHHPESCDGWKHKITTNDVFEIEYCDCGALDDEEVRA